MPDDRPVSPEERRLLRHFVLAFGWRRSYGGGCEVGVTINGKTTTVLDGWEGESSAVDKLVSEVSGQLSRPNGARALSTPAGPGTERICSCGCEQIIDSAPSSREEAVEAGAKALWGLDGNEEDRPWTHASDFMKENYRSDARVALSAARPPSPSPEETQGAEVGYGGGRLEVCACDSAERYWSRDGSLRCTLCDKRAPGREYLDFAHGSAPSGDEPEA